MEHRVAVRADRPKVLNGIHVIAWADLRQRHYVVDVNEARTQWAVQVLETEPTNQTHGAVVSDARLPGGAVSLIGVDENPACRVFAIPAGCELLRTVN